MKISTSLFDHGVFLISTLTVSNNKEIVKRIADALEVLLYQRLFKDWVDGIETDTAIINIKDFWEVIEDNGGRMGEVYFIRATKEELRKKGWTIEKVGNWYTFRK